MGSDVQLASQRLADLCADVSYGYTASANTEPVGPKFLRITDIQGGRFDWNEVPYCTAEPRLVDKYQLARGDIVVARTGNSTGENAQIWSVDEPAVFASYLIRFRVDDRLANPFFVGYQLRSARFFGFVMSVRGGSAQPGANAKQLGSFDVQLVDRKAQDEAVETLRTIDDRIDLLRQTNTTLEAIAQALFKSWFVDFDPVHAKAEGRTPEAMDAATAALFPSEFEESELGPIPKGWRAGTLDDLSHLNPSSWSSKRHPDAVIYVDLSGVHENRIGAVKELPYSDTPSRARRSLRDGDTIVGTVRPGNRAFAYIHHPAANLTGSTGFAVLSPKDEASASFVYLAATRDDSIERLANLADGGAYPAVRPNVVSATPVVIPTTSIITAFSRITIPMLHKIGESRDAEATLVELRDTLLPRLISGKLRLPDVVEATEGVLV